MLACKAGFSALPVVTAKTAAVRRFSKNRLFGSAWRESQHTLEQDRYGDLESHSGAPQTPE